MGPHHRWHTTNSPFVTTARMIFGTNKNTGRYSITNTWRAEDRGSLLCTYQYILYKKSGRWGSGQGPGAFSMNQVGFTSEPRVRKTSIQGYEHIRVHKHHILSSQALPFPLLPLKNLKQNKTKQKTTAILNVEKYSLTVWNRHLCKLCLHCAVRNQKNPDQQ